MNQLLNTDRGQITLESISIVLGKGFNVDPAHIFFLILKYESIDFVVNALEYSEKEKVVLSKSCDILYKSKCFA